MLVLSRKEGESIVLGDNVRIKLFKVQGSRVRLCIQAPQHTRILRGEVYQVIHGSLPAPAAQPAEGRRPTGNAKLV